MVIRKTISIAFVLIILFISACSGIDDQKTKDTKGNETDSLVSEKTEIPPLTLSSDGVLSEDDCSNRELQDMIIMIETKYCSHCKKTLPIFREACEENGIDPIVLDLSIDDNMDMMKSFGIDVRYTPTFIFGCHYYVGSKTKEEYNELIGEYKLR